MQERRSERINIWIDPVLNKLNIIVTRDLKGDDTRDIKCVISLSKLDLWKNIKYKHDAHCYTLQLCHY